MKIEVLRKVDRTLVRSFQNKGLIELVHEEDQDVRSTVDSIDESVNDWDLYLEGSYGRKLKRQRQTLFNREIFSGMSTSGAGYGTDPISYISDYLVSEISINENEVLSADFALYTNLFKPMLRQFKDDLRVEFDKCNLIFSWSVIATIIKELFEVSYRKIGLQNSLILINEFYGIYYSKQIVDDSRSLVEIILEAISFCDTNKDFPVEWLLSHCFENPKSNVKLVESHD